ncbi:hypothetical protein T492DRAFT_867597, partial [Pavlovales sp. CCMP2436]
KRAHLWVRNGYSALKQAALYRTSLFSDVGLAPDLGVLQLCLSRLGMGRFLRGLLARWSLPDMRGEGGEGAEERSEIDPATGEVLLEELLSTLVLLLRERTHSSIAERTLAHRLAAAGAATHSELVNAVPRRVVEHACFDEGSYLLRTETWLLFDPLRWQRDARAPGDPSALPAAPPPPPLARAFASLRTAARCGLLHALLLRALLDAHAGAGQADGVTAIALRLLVECAFAEEAHAPHAHEQPGVAGRAGGAGGSRMEVEGEEGDGGGGGDGDGGAPVVDAAREAALCRLLSLELFGLALPSAHSLLDNALAEVPAPAHARGPPPGHRYGWPSPAGGASSPPPPPPPRASSTLAVLRRGEEVAATFAYLGGADPRPHPPPLGPLQLPAAVARRASAEAAAQARATSPPAAPPCAPLAAAGAAAGSAPGSGDGNGSSGRAPAACTSLLSLLCEMACDERQAAHAAQRAPHALRSLRASQSEGGDTGSEFEAGSPCSPLLLSCSPGGETPGRAARRQQGRERQAAILRQFESKQAQFNQVVVARATEPPPVQTTASGCACDHLDAFDEARGGTGGGARAGGSGGGARTASTPSTPLRTMAGFSPRGAAGTPRAATSPGAGTVSEEEQAGEEEPEPLVCVLCREEWAPSTAMAAAAASGGEAELVGRLAYVQLGATLQREASPAAARAALAAAEPQPPRPPPPLSPPLLPSEGAGESDSFVRLEDLTGPAADEVRLLLQLLLV